MQDVERDIRSFEGLGLGEDQLEVLRELGFTMPTPVQRASIPILLAGKDLIAQASTGTGKTAAFSLPLLARVTLEDRVPTALVICPTRELSAQVAREIRKLGRKHKGLRVLVLSGGELRRRQTQALHEGAHVLVGTPGRVLDHLKRGDLKLATVRSVVLDEADRMLDMGFAEDMDAILAELPTVRQTAFFSATFPQSIAAMSERHQSAPTRVTVESETEAPEIRQLAIKTEPSQRLETLLNVLKAYPHDSALVFTNFKASVAEVEKALTREARSAAALSGDLEQFDRDRVMAKFRNGSIRVLVATDVAARGIDVEGLDLVVNYEVPTRPELYVHRIGRTGRAGHTGVAISLLVPADKAYVMAIEALTGQPIERVQLPKASELPARSPAAARDAKMDTLRILGGRKDKVRPGDILGALTGEAGGLPGDDVGKIEIHDTFSFVAVSRAVSRDALKRLQAGRIKGKRFRVLLEK